MKKILICILITAAFAPLQGKAQKGTLDLSFGTGGIAHADFLGETLIFNQSGWKTLPTADGKSYLIIEMNDQAIITRRLSNGSIDAAYGNNGYSVPVDNMRPITGAVQSDGKIIVAGAIGNSNGFMLVRYNPSGSLDVSFGNNGKVQTRFPYGGGGAYSFGTAHSIVVQSDSKILAAGFSAISTSGSNAFALARYNPDGSLDATFGDSGKVQTPFLYDGTNSSAGATSVLLLPDGKFIATGHADAGGRNFGFALARYTASGVLDPSFGTGGKVQTPFPYDGVNSMALSMSSALQSDGKIVMAGYYDGDALFPTTERGFALARYNTDGSLDATFDGDGKLQTAFFFDATQSYAVAYSVVIQSDDKILAAGVANVQAYNPAFAVTRYNPDGSLDSSFGNNGKAQTPFPYNDTQTYANALSAALQSDGKLIAVGSANSGYGSSYALVRYNLDGSLDASFDGDGKVVDSIRTGWTNLNITAVQSDGKIVSAGSYQMSLSNDKGFALARFSPNGTPDATFGNNGKVQTPFFHSYASGNFSSATAQALAIQSDGKIIAAGESHAGNGNIGFALARYNPNGSPDATFGNNGKVESVFPTVSFSYSRSYAYALAVQSDGKILAAGTTDYLNNYSFFAVARYNPDGSLDSTFGNNGLVKTFFGSGSISTVRSLAVQADGKIIAAGMSKPGINYAFTLVRYNQDGSLDASFSTDGIEHTDFGPNSFSGITSVMIQNDGKIVAVGSLSIGTSNRMFAVARYNNDGSLDAGFNGNGKAQTSFPYDGGNSFAITQSMAVHADGKIAAAGYALAGSGNPAVAFARYNPDGSPDITLGENGKVLGVTNVPLAGMTITSTKVYSAGSTKYYGYLGAVAAFNYNAAPTLAPIGNKKVSAGGVLSFRATGTDTDIPVQPLSYSISFLPNGASFNQTTGEFSWAPSSNQSGDYVTTFSVTDGIAAAEETITITVNKPSPRLAPVIETYAPHSGPVGTLVTLTGTGFTDITGVKFNGVSATYTVIDSTTITTTVPQGATTGKISVTNANGTAYSRGKFTVPGTGPGNNRTVLTSVAETKVIAAPTTLSVTALPNPAWDYFTLVIQTSNREPISINVRDASGKLIERRNIETARTLRIGDHYRSGIYFVEVLQGRERVTIRLIKSGG